MSTDDREELDRAAAKVKAIEAIVLQVLRPLLESVQPGSAAKVIEAIRMGLNVSVRNEYQRLAAEEYLQRFADDVEAHLRARLCPRR